MAAASRGKSEIRVTRDVENEVWSDQRLIADGIDAAIVGGYATCLDDVATGRSTIAGMEGEPLLKVRGTIALELRGLNLKGGTANEDTFGGVVDFQGNGELRIADARVTGASSSHPDRAAVGVRGVLDASLTLGDDVAIVDNLTSGLMAIAHARLELRGERVSLSRNEGDGLLLQNVESADIALADADISHNAGFALRYRNPEWPLPGDGFVRLRSTRSSAPLRIEENRTGAILVTATNRARTLCMSNVNVLGHVASGSPQDFNASVIRIDGRNARLTNECDAIGNASDRACMAAACNLVANNMSNGPLISVTGGASARIEKMFLLANSAPTLIGANDDHRPGASVVDVRNSLFADNDVGESIASTGRFAIVSVGATTIARNAGPFGRTFQLDDGGRLVVSTSIVDQEQTLLTADGPGAMPLFIAVLARNIGDAWPRGGVLIGRPSFRDNSFELEPTSLGIDAASAQGGLDIRGNVRDVDLLDVPDARKPRDLGAFETPAPRPDSIFGDGFEGSWLRREEPMPMPRTRRALRVSH